MQLPGVGGYPRGEVAPFIFRELHVGPFERARESEDRRERPAQVVRDRPQEDVLDLVRLPQAIGGTIELDKQAFTVVGVMPPDFRGQSGTADVWLPMTAATACSTPLPSTPTRSVSSNCPSSPACIRRPRTAS